MKTIDKKKIYLHGFNQEQIKIIKSKNRKAIFIAENKISDSINKCHAIISPTRKSIEEALDKVNFKRNNVLKWIHLPGSGVEKYYKYFKYKKIIFTNGKRIQNHQISDHAIGLLLCLTRKINFNIKYGQKVKFDQRPVELNQKKAVIIGMGGNGTMIAKKLLAFKMNVTAVSDIKQKKLRSINYFLTNKIKHAVKDKDVIIISTPLTKYTNGLINKDILKLLAKGAIVINVSRALCLNLNDLIFFLKNKHLGGAGLDVVEGEPINDSHMLLKFKNVIVTPHTGGISDNLYVRNLKLILNNIKKFIDKKKLMNLVDIKRGY